MGISVIEGWRGEICHMVLPTEMAILAVIR